MNHHPRGVFLWKPSTCQVLFLKMCVASNSCSTSPGGPPVGWKIFKTCGCSSGSSVSLRMMFTYSSHGYRGSIPRYAGGISRCRNIQSHTIIMWTPNASGDLGVPTPSHWPVEPELCGSMVGLRLHCLARTIEIRFFRGKLAKRPELYPPVIKHGNRKFLHL